eukprot:scaffold5533_cov159-Amphora_coffeaeformis.AAC.7
MKQEDSFQVLWGSCRGHSVKDGDYDDFVPDQNSNCCVEEKEARSALVMMTFDEREDKALPRCSAAERIFRSHIIASQTRRDDDSTKHSFILIYIGGEQEN